MFPTLPAPAVRRGPPFSAELTRLTHAPLTSQGRSKMPTVDKDFDAPYYEPTVFFCLSKENPLRRGCIKFMEWVWFDRFILLTIVANAIVLCMMEPKKLEGRGCGDFKATSTSGGNVVIEGSELVFTTIFTIEFLVKVVAMGFLFNKGSYLKDGWNVMDFIVVVVSLVSLLPGAGSNASALRVIRVLRPLRTLSVLPGMRTLIGTIIRSVPMIGNVLLFCIFFFTIFGIFGLNIFMGILRNRCFTEVAGKTCADLTASIDGEYALMCRDELSPTSGVGTAYVLLADDDEQACAMSKMHWEGYFCPAGQMCLKGQNPNYGITHFDNIGYAWLAIFQCITLEGWTPIMYMTMDATTGWSVIYFILLVFTGGFFLLNLALAVITEVYDEENTEAKDTLDEEEDKEEAEETRKQFIKKAAREKRHELGLYSDSEDDTDDDEDGSKKLRKEERRALKEEERRKAENATLSGRIRRFFRGIIESKWFNPLFVVLILVNTLVLAMEYDGMPKTYGDTLATINLVLTIAFIVEMVFKVLGLGPRKYVQDSFNIFDAVVVIMSIVELAMANSGSLSALRSFRILRVLKLVRSWKKLQNFLYTIYLTLISLGEFSFVVILTLFIFALLGMQMFGGKMCGLDDGEIPRHNFDTLLWALVTVFQVLTGEDWNAVMYDGMEVGGSWSALYFVLLLIIGQFMVLNLFVAILLTNFGEHEVSDEMQDARLLLENVKFFSTYMSKETGKADLSPAELEEKRFWANLPDKVYKPRVFSKWLKLATKAKAKLGEEKRKKEEEAAELVRREDAAREARKAAEEQKRKDLEAKGYGQVREGSLICGFSCFKCTPQPGGAPKPLWKYEGKSLGLFSVQNYVRRWCYDMVDDKKFDMVIMTFIVISSLTMAFESPKVLESSAVETLNILDWIFTIIFVIEMIMKLIAYGAVGSDFKKKGWFCDDGAYIRDPWNCMDGFIVAISIFAKAMDSGNMEWVRALRTMRVLRPLRVISRVPELKVVVNALFRSLPGLGNVFLVSLLFWLIFGILGMQLFMGAFAKCYYYDESGALTDDDDIEAKSACIDGWHNVTGIDRAWDAITASCNDGNISTEGLCVSAYDTNDYRLRMWKSQDMNFDNVFNAMQTLFEMSTTEGWTAVMYMGVDARSPDLAPKRDNTPALAFFFLAFMIVANFFILNLFIGIILDNFAQISEESGDGGSATMTKEQKLWVQRKTQLLGETVKKDYPTDPTRNALYKFVEKEPFEYFIMFVILLNAVMMACEYYDQPQSWTDALEMMGYVFGAIFISEAAMKLYAMNPYVYFSDQWNCFDFFCVFITVLGWALGGGGAASVLRVLRLARIFRLIRKLKGLRMLFNTLLISVPGLINIGSLLFLLCFVYAILGMNIFGKVQFGENLNKHANFRNFGQSILLLLRMVTGEAWNSVMYDCMITPANSGCDDSSECAIGECCGSQGAPAYFISFVVLGTFVTLNLLIAVVVDNFSNQKREEEGEDVTDENIKEFEIAWRRLDPEVTGYIPLSEVINLIKETPPPMGTYGTNITRMGMIRFMKNLNLHTGDSEYLHYQEALSAFTTKAMGLHVNDLSEETKDEVKQSLSHKAKHSMQSLGSAEALREHADGASDGRGVAFVNGKSRASLKPGLAIVKESL